MEPNCVGAKAGASGRTPPSKGNSIDSATVPGRSSTSARLSASEMTTEVGSRIISGERVRFRVGAVGLD